MAGSWRSHLPILVYGAYGHTGRFIVAELVNRGFTPVLSGRDRQKLAAVSSLHGGLEVRAASLDDSMALERALAGTAAAGKPQQNGRVPNRCPVLLWLKCALQLLE
jgi:short subunit dehydrogenase-like uncharacterized protein